MNNSRKQYFIEYYKTHKNELKEYQQKYCQEHKKKRSNTQKKYRQNHEIEIKQYKENRKQETLQYYKEYKHKRRQTDINYKLREYLRSRIWSALNGICKSKSTIKLVGCSIEQLKSHLENQFKNGMTWENYGMWHVDHIRPCASFDLSKVNEQLKCFNYKNLQPLWAVDNREKSNN